jgi:RNA polymerase sigma factor (sigma-70 family)
MTLIRQGKFAVNSRTRWRTLPAVSSRQTGFFLCDFWLGGCYKVNMTPDCELLGRYAQTKSEEAFAELVRRHVNLVYSAALRQVNGDAHLAQDVAQTVFTDLARKASALSRRATLAGWLYTSAHFAAAKAARTENRRRNREEQLMREPIHESAPAADWEKLRPVLDDAMHELKEADREAVLLRYFEGRQFAEVGAKLGLNENAARMRVERALEKLRASLTKRGLAATAALASAISANAIQVAPVGLAATLTTSSLAGAGTGTFVFLKIMTMTQLKLGVTALAVAGAATVMVVQQQAQKQLRTDNASLQQQLAQLQIDSESLSNRLAATGNARPLSDEQLNELLKLRGEVGVLRRRTNQLEKLSMTPNAPPPKPGGQEDSDADPQRQQAMARMSNAKQFVLTMMLYANDNEGVFPTRFDQMTNSFNDGLRTALRDLEITYQGALSNIHDPASTIVVRESQPWLYNGKWSKVYGFADGHSEVHTEPGGNFDAYEQQHMFSPPANQ